MPTLCHADRPYEVRSQCMPLKCSHGGPVLRVCKQWQLLFANWFQLPLERHPQRWTEELACGICQPVTFGYRFHDLEVLETPKYRPNGVRQAVLIYFHLQEIMKQHKTARKNSTPNVIFLERREDTTSEENVCTLSLQVNLHSKVKILF